jgi:hypothetical protein
MLGMLARQSGSIDMTAMNSSKHGPKHHPKMRPPFKVRHEPPTLEEAIYAAQGVTTDLEQQVELAAELIDMPSDTVRTELLKSAARPANKERVFVPARSGMQRAVVITTTGRPRSRQTGDFASRSLDRAGSRPVGHRGAPRSRYPS